jgi:hypothetical protein
MDDGVISIEPNSERADLYQALGVGAGYDAGTHTAVLEVEPAWGQVRVGWATPRQVAASLDAQPPEADARLERGIEDMPACRRATYRSVPRDPA